jgi:adenylosuccinate synthase
MARKIQVIVGGQFGSEGKGHCAVELARREDEMLAIRTGGPNAGHTAYGVAGLEIKAATREFKLRQVPVAAVANPRATCAISARSLVQLDLVEREAKETGVPVLVIDQAATVLESAHITVEEADDSLAWGSTRKGIGAARMDRLHRTARTWADLVPYYDTTKLVEADVARLARNFLNGGATVQIEAAQGYGLGLHTEFYPKTTSADCRAIDALADVGLSPWEFSNTELEIWVVVRPYPIRVAGDSGPLRNETSWEALGLPAERTTVTNKVRRVGLWDPTLVAEAVLANGVRNVKLWMNMADHPYPFLSGLTSLDEVYDKRFKDVEAWLERVEIQTGAKVAALGTGPNTAIFLED